MQSTGSHKEAVMLEKHLTRLTVMVVTASILVASFAELAAAGIRHGEQVTISKPEAGGR